MKNLHNFFMAASLISRGIVSNYNIKILITVNKINKS